LASLILVVNVVGKLQQKRTLAASRGFLAAARLSCNYWYAVFTSTVQLRQKLFPQQDSTVTEGVDSQFKS